MSVAEATPMKLRSGEWGAKVRGIVREGETITVITKSGKKWDAQVSKVIWSGNGVTLVATASRSTERVKRRKTTWTGCSCGSVEEYEKDSDCFTCRHDRW